MFYQVSNQRCVTVITVANREQGPAFHEDTIWHNRDLSKDKSSYYNEGSYYGVKGIRRVPNSYIVGGCFFLICLGWVRFYLFNK